MKSLWVVLGVVALLIVVLLFIGGSYIGAKNTLVQKNEAVNQAFSQVDVQQQRRLDLIPNLVASVKGYVAEESPGTQDVQEIIRVCRRPASAYGTAT